MTAHQKPWSLGVDGLDDTNFFLAQMRGRHDAFALIIKGNPRPHMRQAGQDNPGDGLHGIKMHDAGVLAIAR